MVEQPAVNRLVVGSSPTCRVFYNSSRCLSLRQPAFARQRGLNRSEKRKPSVFFRTLNSGACHAQTENGRVPSYRLHKQSGQAIVTFNGKDHTLGEHGSAVSKEKYNRLIAEWLSNNRQLPTKLVSR